MLSPPRPEWPQKTAKKQSDSLLLLSVASLPFPFAVFRGLLGLSQVRSRDCPEGQDLDCVSEFPDSAD